MIRTKFHARYLFNEAGRFHVKQQPRNRYRRPPAERPVHKEAQIKKQETREEEIARDMWLSLQRVTQSSLDALVDSAQQLNSTYSAITDGDEVREEHYETLLHVYAQFILQYMKISHLFGRLLDEIEPEAPPWTESDDE